MEDLIPMKKSNRLPVLQEVRGFSLTISAAKALLAKADVVSEGVVENPVNDERIYRGSTLVSIDTSGAAFELPLCKETAARLEAALRRSVLFRIGLMRVARKEAERRVYPRFVREMRADTSFRVVDNRLLIDIDIECPLADVMGNASSRKARCAK